MFDKSKTWLPHKNRTKGQTVVCPSVSALVKVLCLGTTIYKYEEGPWFAILVKFLYPANESWGVYSFSVRSFVRSSVTLMLTLISRERQVTLSWHLYTNSLYQGQHIASQKWPFWAMSVRLRNSGLPFCQPFCNADFIDHVRTGYQCLRRHMLVFFSSPGPKVHVSYCHHLASVVVVVVVCRRR